MSPVTCTEAGPDGVSYRIIAVTDGALSLAATGRQSTSRAVHSRYALVLSRDLGERLAIMALRLSGGSWLA
ncbi:MAG: hypothetical protein DMG65_08695 [Candidatus Angelobacter sp. Gp1-AA117]|nr:MAG: hypothetical protein DMG65_08695 [Candidatus Angelobacter sp. Gp1-AA117]